MKLKALATGMFAIAAIVVAVMAGAGATTASFSDKVTSSANSFKAGTLQLQMGSSACANPANRTYGGVTGNAGVDGNTGCTVTGGATYSPATTAMKPGDTSAATYSVKNVGSLSGTLSVGTTSWSVTTAGKGTCTVSASNFTISSTYSAASVAAGATASVPVSGAVPASSADGCQGATFTASVPFLMNGASTTGFSDQLTSTGNTFTMTTLPAPVLTAALNTDTTKVNLTWTGSFGSFPGTTFTGARYAGGACAGSPTAVNSGNAISSGYVDAPGSAGQYSYIVTAHFATNWVAVSNCATATTSIPTKAASFGAGDLPATTHAPYNSALFTLAASGTVTSQNNWSASITITGPTNPNWQGSALQVDIWLIPGGGTCAAAPSPTSANYIAGNPQALTSVTVPEITAPLGTKSIPIVGNSNFAPSSTTGTICLLITNVDLNSGASHEAIWSGGTINGVFS